MPRLNNGHTQAPAYMIGEKVAQLVLEDNDMNNSVKKIALSTTIALLRMSARLSAPFIYYFRFIRSVFSVSYHYMRDHLNGF
jgi:ascorbate-specific PTS system EIIC-type component UlaA